ncbi:MAG: cysteine methyltransferase [Thermoproteota archaeon]|nr:MAG: cysteine methyltransferase [Candidatus Korarchaeota archaeon]
MDLEIAHLIVDLFEGRIPLRRNAIKLYPVSGRKGLLLETIKKIPRGKVTTYRALGTLLKMHPRAVGGYIASNPFPLIIPCHRVVKSDLTLGGYSYGQLIKGNLLLREGVDIDIETGRISPSDVLEYEDLLKIVPLRVLV